jgi:ATPase subunit of ABC transporter with duplicated ATPase domains
LDVNTLRALEEALLNFAGCAVVISHDRWFLDRVATHILALKEIALLFGMMEIIPSMKKIYIRDLVHLPINHIA